MDYLTFIERLARHTSLPSGLQFLVSGSDPVVWNTVLADVAQMPGGGQGAAGDRRCRG